MRGCGYDAGDPGSVGESHRTVRSDRERMAYSILFLGSFFI